MSKLNPYFLPEKRGLNPYFSYMGETFSNANEQAMQDSLIQEYIQQFGTKAIYICRTPHNLDVVFGESAGSNFEKSFEIEMMMADYVAGFGNRDEVQAFGYNMHDEIELQCSYTRLNYEMSQLDLSDRTDSFPAPGDLIYFPLYKTMLEILFIDSKDPNQPMGASVLYKITCKVYNPNTETFSTNIPDIDIINEFNTIYNEEKEGNKIQEEADDIIEEEPNMWKTLLRQEKPE